VEKVMGEYTSAFACQGFKVLGEGEGGPGYLLQLASQHESNIIEQLWQHGSSW